MDGHIGISVDVIEREEDRDDWEFNIQQLENGKFQDIRVLDFTFFSDTSNTLPMVVLNSHYFYLEMQIYEENIESDNYTGLIRYDRLIGSALELALEFD